MNGSSKLCCHKRSKSMKHAFRLLNYKSESSFHNGKTMKKAGKQKKRNLKKMHSNFKSEEFKSKSGKYMRKCERVTFYKVVLLMEV